MKIIHYTSERNGRKQSAFVAMTMQVIYTRGKNQNHGKGIPVKEIPLKKFSKDEDPIPVRNSTSVEWKLLKDKDYSIRYPTNWTLDRSGKMDLEFMLLAEPTSPFNPFRQNINLLVMELEESMTLDEFTRLSEEQIETQVVDGKLLESRRITHLHGEFHRLAYSGKSAKFNLKFLQYFWLRNGRIYLLTLTCEIDKFDDYLETSKKSFRVSG
jgi:hypothetical protein